MRERRSYTCFPGHRRPEDKGKDQGRVPGRPGNPEVWGTRYSRGPVMYYTWSHVLFMTSYLTSDPPQHYGPTRFSSVRLYRARMASELWGAVFVFLVMGLIVFLEWGCLDECSLCCGMNRKIFMGVKIPLWSFFYIMKFDWSK